MHHSTICYSSNATLATFSQYVSTAELPKGSLLLLCKQAPPTVKRWPNKWAVFRDTALQLIPRISLLVSGASCWTKLRTRGSENSLSHGENVWILCKRSYGATTNVFLSSGFVFALGPPTPFHISASSPWWFGVTGRGDGHNLRHAADTWFISRGTREASFLFCKTATASLRLVQENLLSVSIHTYVCINAYNYTHLNIYVYVFIYMHTHTYMRICIFRHIYSLIYINICMHTDTC